MVTRADAAADGAAQPAGEPSGPCFVFAGGGTGGHLFPGLAVASELVRLEPRALCVFFTTDRTLDRDLLARTSHARVVQPVRPFPANPLHWPRFLLAWRRSVHAALHWLQRSRPRAVLGLGGYAAAPAVVAAQKLGIRRAILNPDAVPGRANRWLAARVDLVVLQWDAARGRLPPRSRARTLGCPIRAEFADAAKRARDDAQAQRRARTRFELDADRPVLLVTGASQGARTVNSAVVAVWPDFIRQHPQWQVLHLAGATDESAVRSAYGAGNAPARVLAFTHEMAEAILAADVVVSRAGASTLAELTALARPSILLPYPYHRDRHQHANARVLADAGAAILIDDARDTDANAPPLLEALTQLADPRTRAHMAASAAALARPDAAERVARWLLEDSIDVQ